MKSGEKIAGKVEKVTEKLVHLSHLSGAEYFEGVVDVNDNRGCRGADESEVAAASGEA